MKQKLWIALSVFSLGLLIGFVSSSSQADPPASAETQVAPNPHANIPFYVRDIHGHLVPNPALTEALQESLIEEEELAAEDALEAAAEEAELAEHEQPAPAPAPNRPTPRMRGLEHPLAPLPPRRQARDNRQVRPRTDHGAGVTVTF